MWRNVAVSAARLARNWIFIGVVTLLVLVGGYALLFLPVQHIVYGYTQENCLDRLTLAPTWQHIKGDEEFAGSFAGDITLWGRRWASTKICWHPRLAPQPGRYEHRISPFGGPVAATTISITVSELPKVSLTPLNKDIPLTKSLELPLSKQDEVFAYVLAANGTEVDCVTSDTRVKCDPAELSLKQGETYLFTLIRAFGDERQTLFTRDVHILNPVKVTDSSIKADEMVYSRPTSIRLSLDKPLTKAKAQLRMGDTEVETTTVVDGQNIEVSFAELDRQQEFRLSVMADAQDGSTLVEPYQLHFTTSGGPKVIEINIGRSGVALGTTAVITFDQALSPDQDVQKLASVSGGGGVSLGERTLSVDLGHISRCGRFTITVADGVLSTYGIPGQSAWQYSSRVTCRSSEVIGYSTQGRPIVAYTFGSGGTTMLFTGTIHGNEVNAKRLLDRWMAELEAHIDSIPAGRSVVIVPLVNPDGYASGSRYNSRGVDLNRNFAVSDWRSDITDVYNRPLPGGGGVEPMSEKETQVLAAFTKRLRPRLTMSYHSQGGLVIANQAGNSRSLAARYASLSGYRDATGQSAETFEYSITGTYDDWIAEKLGLPSVLIEIGYNHTDPQWSRNIEGLWAMLRS